MTTELYLDTARLGRMCRGARVAEQDFATLASQLGSSLYLENFLTSGFCSLPLSCRKRVPNLRCWDGITGLKRRFGQFVNQPDGCPISFFSQSQTLIRFAAECLFRSAKRVLMTDLAWPAYLHLLQDTARKRNASLHILPLEDLVFNDQIDASAVVDRLLHSYHAQGCDGIFLSDISYLGARLPVREFLNLIPKDQQPFVVVDGAQALGHRPIDLGELNCDLYLAGTQKWFQAYHPLRIAFAVRPESVRLIQDTQREYVDRLADPLLQFCEAAESNNFVPVGETVNVTPLIAAAGALRHHVRSVSMHGRWKRRLQNVATAIEYLPNHAWRPKSLDPSLGSGITLLETANPRLNTSTTTELRNALASQRIVASAFARGILRFSMPDHTIRLPQLAQLGRALRIVACCKTRQYRRLH